MTEHTSPVRNKLSTNVNFNCESKTLSTKLEASESSE